MSRLFHLRYKYRHSIPYPVHYESGNLTMLYIKELLFFQKSKIHYFWCRKRNSLVKLIDTYLISSAMPFFLSDLFLRSLFHIETTEWTILCMESRLRAAFADLRFILSCSKLKSSVQCMLSIDQCLRTNEPNAGVLVGRLLTYSRFSEACAPDFFLTVSDSYSIIIILPPHFSLSVMMPRPSKTR